MMKRIIILTVFSVTLIGCNINPNKEERIQNLETEIVRLKKLTTQKPNDTKGSIITSLTFQKNDAEEAMNFYVGLFEKSKITDIQRWGEDGPTEEGTIMIARFELNGAQFMCSDSPPVHDWDFTPAVSNYVECENENELERLFSKLSENGKVMMPLNDYGFSQKFGFVEDRFGVSWQLNLK